MPQLVPEKPLGSIRMIAGQYTQSTHACVICISKPVQKENVIRRQRDERKTARYQFASPDESKLMKRSSKKCKQWGEVCITRAEVQVASAWLKAAVWPISILITSLC
jgi:hypothetical protein